VFKGAEAPARARFGVCRLDLRRGHLLLVAPDGVAVVHHCKPQATRTVAPKEV
jgi:hypothetical protein